MGYLIFGLLVLGGLLLLAKWFASASPGDVKRVLRLLAFVLGAAFLLWLVLGGARVLAVVLAPFLLPLLFGARGLWQRMKAMTGPRPGQTSTVETRFLRMTLDHDSGAMEGTVREGPFRGRRLDELGKPELLELWRTCRAEDEQSAQVLEAWLDREHGDAWREAAGAAPGGTEEASEARDEQDAAGRRSARGAGSLTLDEAYEVLGLQPGATKDEIHAAHRRLMRQYHPDSGGSNYLAAKINEAKDLLLRHA
jgi:hypothetical protein